MKYRTKVLNELTKQNKNIVIDTDIRMLVARRDEGWEEGKIGKGNQINGN